MRKPAERTNSTAGLPLRNNPPSRRKLSRAYGSSLIFFGQFHADTSRSTDCWCARARRQAIIGFELPFALLSLVTGGLTLAWNFTRFRGCDGARG